MRALALLLALLGAAGAASPWIEYLRTHGLLVLLRSDGDGDKAALFPLDDFSLTQDNATQSFVPPDYVPELGVFFSDYDDDFAERLRDSYALNPEAQFAAGRNGLPGQLLMRTRSGAPVLITVVYRLQRYFWYVGLACDSCALFSDSILVIAQLLE